MLTLTNGRSGFTIVELLIVIVVIGILATITIVGYSSVQSRARIATIQSDLSNNVKKIELSKLNGTSGTYPTSLNDVKAADLTFGRDAYKWILYCTDTTNYIFAARSATTDRWWIAGNNQTLTESTAPGFSGSGATTCSNLGFTTTTYNGWILSNSGWSI